MCTFVSIFLDTFKAYDSDNDNRISRKEFIQFIEDSWKAAFRILAENCDGKNFGRLGLRDLETFAAGKVSSLNEHSGKLFSKLDSTKKGVHIHSLSSSSSKLSRSSPLAQATMTSWLVWMEPELLFLSTLSPSMDSEFVEISDSYAFFT